MNIIFFLTPKAKVTYVKVGQTIRQVLEKMEFHHYSAVPLIDNEGKYIGTISDSDLLWTIKERKLDLKMCGEIRIENIKVSREISPIHINKNIDELCEYIINQNFAPVVDDRDLFIGIITRKSVIEYLLNQLKFFKKE